MSDDLYSKFLKELKVQREQKIIAMLDEEVIERLKEVIKGDEDLLKFLKEYLGRAASQAYLDFVNEEYKTIMWGTGEKVPVGILSLEGGK